MTIKYLLIKCKLTLLKPSGAMDIQSTTTILVRDDFKKKTGYLVTLIKRVGGCLKRMSLFQKYIIKSEGEITKSRVIEIVSNPKYFPETSQTKGLRPFSLQVVGPLALLPLI